MPTQKALKTVRERGFIAAGHSQKQSQNPYTHPKARAYAIAWLQGWFNCHYALRELSSEPVFIVCDSCGKRRMTLTVNDTFDCDSCGYSVSAYPTDFEETV